MYISTLTKDSPVREKQIDANIHKLYLKCRFTDPNLRYKTGNPMKEVLDMLDCYKLSIQKQSATGNVPIMMPISLATIAELCANREGHINAKYRYTSASDYCVVEFQVDLSPYAIKLEDNKFLLLTLEKYRTFYKSGDTTVNHTIEIYGVEYPAVSDQFIAYKQHKVNAGAQKNLSLVGVDLLALPRTGFDQIDLVFPDRTVSYKGDIKSIINSLENLIALYVATDDSPDNTEKDPEFINGSVTYNVAQNYYDGINLYTIGVASALEAKLYYTEDTTVITAQLEEV